MGQLKLMKKDKNRVGYAVTTDSKVVKAGPLPGHLSAQAAELIALTEACKLYKGKEVTIYTDSLYAFATVHQYCQQWKNRGYQTSTGKPVTHKELLQDLLEAILLPKAIAVCKCAAHTKGTDFVNKGNDFVDKAAKETVMSHVLTMTVENYVLKDKQQKAPDSKKSMWCNKGAVLKDDIYT